jgi:hypothetical protein
LPAPLFASLTNTLGISVEVLSGLHAPLGVALFLRATPPPKTLIHWEPILHVDDTPFVRRERWGLHPLRALGSEFIVIGIGIGRRHLECVKCRARAGAVAYLVLVAAARQKWCDFANRAIAVSGSSSDVDRRLGARPVDQGGMSPVGDTW